MNKEEYAKRIEKIEQELEEVEKIKQELRELRETAVNVLSELQGLCTIPTSKERYLLSEDLEEEKPLEQMTFKELLEREEELKHLWRRSARATRISSLRSA